MTKGKPSGRRSLFAFQFAGVGEGEGMKKVLPLNYFVLAVSFIHRRNYKLIYNPRNIL